MSATARLRRILSPRYFLILGLWVAGMIVTLVVLMTIDSRVVDAPIYVCPPDCGRPPTGLPVSNTPQFVAADDSFSVGYPGEGPAFTITTDANGVTARSNVGDGGTLRLFGTPAGGREARQVVEEFMADAFPDSVVSYEIPNATVGYHPGYGMVADFMTRKRAETIRVIAISAVKNGLALVAVAEGPYLQFGPGVGPGPPSPANVQIAQIMGRYLDSFMWRGDPPR